MTSYDKCNICGKPIRSLDTHALGEHWFCRDCYFGLVHPLANLLSYTIVRLFAGDGNQKTRRDVIRSLEPGSGHQITLGLARLFPFDGGFAGDPIGALSFKDGVPIETEKDPTSQDADRNVESTREEAQDAEWHERVDNGEDRVGW